MSEVTIKRPPELAPEDAYLCTVLMLPDGSAHLWGDAIRGARLADLARPAANLTPAGAAKHESALIRWRAAWSRPLDSLRMALGRSLAEWRSLAADDPERLAEEAAAGRHEDGNG